MLFNTYNIVQHICFFHMLTYHFNENVIYNDKKKTKTRDYYNKLELTRFEKSLLAHP